MKKYIKYISYIILITICLNTFSLSISASDDHIFSDVDENDWFYNNLSELKSREIISGFPDGSFKGNSKLTIDQTVKMLTQAFGYSLQKSDGYWANNFIYKALELNWFNGLSISDYTNPISRYETCKILVNALGNTLTYPDNLTDYKLYIKDYHSIPTQYKNDVLKVYYLGIISGYPDGNFNGNNTLTRAESASIILRLIKSSQRLVPLDPLTLDKLNEVFLDKNIINDFSYILNYVKFENNKFYYKNEHDLWITKKQMKITTNIANILEKTFSNILLTSINNDFKEYKLAAGYSYGAYNINLFDKFDNTIIKIISFDNSDVISLKLGYLYDDEGNLNSKISYILYGICQTIDLENGKDIFLFILDNYSNINNIPVDGSHIVIGDFNINITKNYNEFKIDIIFN